MQTATVESYFEAQSGASHTSDRTLARLETPRLDAAELSAALSGVAPEYSAEKQALFNGYRSQFNKWMRQMWSVLGFLATVPLGQCLTSSLSNSIHISLLVKL